MPKTRNTSFASTKELENECSYKFTCIHAYIYTFLISLVNWRGWEGREEGSEGVGESKGGREGGSGGRSEGGRG